MVFTGHDGLKVSIRAFGTSIELLVPIPKSQILFWEFPEIPKNKNKILLAADLAAGRYSPPDAKEEEEEEDPTRERTSGSVLLAGEPCS